MKVESFVRLTCGSVFERDPDVIKAVFLVTLPTCHPLEALRLCSFAVSPYVLQY